MRATDQQDGSTERGMRATEQSMRATEQSMRATGQPEVPSRHLKLLAAVAICLLFAGTWILWRAEPRANTAQTQFDLILVLGTPSNPDGTISPEQRERVLEGIREWRRGVAPRLVMSGTAAHNNWVEAHTMAQFAQVQGVPAQDLIEEGHAYNTIQNVWYTVRIMQEHGWHSAEVVSSWNHLPRAARILEHFPIQWTTVAAPWPREYSRPLRLVLDGREAGYCLLLRLRGFKPSRFISR